MGHQMRIVLIHEGLRVKLANDYTIWITQLYYIIGGGSFCSSMLTFRRSHYLMVYFYSTDQRDGFMPFPKVLEWTGGARGVMVIVEGYGHGDKSSNPGPDWLHFT